jgi:hypothetical protein
VLQMSARAKVEIKSDAPAKNMSPGLLSIDIIQVRKSRVELAPVMMKTCGRASQ